MARAQLESILLQCILYVKLSCTKPLSFKSDIVAQIRLVIWNIFETFIFYEQKKIIAIWFTNYPVLTSQFMKRNLRGEMTVVAKEDISILDFELIESVAQELRLSSTEVHVNTCNKSVTKWYLSANLNQSTCVL